MKGPCSSVSTKSRSVDGSSMDTSRKSPDQGQSTASSLPTEKTRTSTSKTLHEPKPECVASYGLKILEYCAGIPYDESLDKFVPQDEKDELILLLIPRVQELQIELESWIQWANKKVMQATRRLGMDKVEIKALRQQKEEGDTSKKEKKQLEDKTLKRLFELEKTIAKHNSKFEQATLTIRKLELENCRLKVIFEEERMNAQKKLALQQQLLEREQVTTKKAQSVESGKATLLADLTKEKQKLPGLETEVDKVRKLHAQTEARLKQEIVEKEKLLKESASIRRERKQMEDRTVADLEKMKLKEAKDIQRYHERIKKLKDEIYMLKLKSEVSKITALNRGKQNQNLSKTLLSFQDTVGTGSLGRARECVMCLSEETSVVFLPCAHQVLCKSCNHLHGKQGMKDCPSCRTPIQKRVHARFASRTNSYS